MERETLVPFGFCEGEEPVAKRIEDDIGEFHLGNRGTEAVDGLVGCRLHARQLAGWLPGCGAGWVCGVVARARLQHERGGPDVAEPVAGDVHDGRTRCNRPNLPPPISLLSARIAGSRLSRSDR